MEMNPSWEATSFAVTQEFHNIVKGISDFRRGFWLANRFIGYTLLVTTNSYNT
jgi:hypothetical protein